MPIIGCRVFFAQSWKQIQVFSKNVIKKLCGHGTHQMAQSAVAECLKDSHMATGKQPNCWNFGTRTRVISNDKEVCHNYQ